MKICVAGTRGFPLVEGGVENHCEALYPLLDEDISITVFRRKPYINENNKKTEYKNISFSDLPSTTIKGVEALLHSFLATVKILFMRPDIVHLHNIGPALFAPLIKLSGAKIVLTYHSANYEHSKWNSASKALLRLCEKTALKYSDKIIFVNSFQMQKFSDEIQKKSIYIPNGIEKPVFTNSTDEIDAFGIERHKYILAVGRITPEKDFATLIKAFNKSNAQKLGYKLVIAGGVEFENSYKDELDRLVVDDSVVFTGYVYGKTLTQLYENAALFVLSSVNEGFPLVLLEAMAFRLNIAASDIPASRLVELGEDSYFEAKNDAALARLINKKLSEPCVYKEYNLTEFNWNDIAQQTSALYRELLEKE